MSWWIETILLILFCLGAWFLLSSVLDNVFSFERKQRLEDGARYARYLQWRVEQWQKEDEERQKRLKNFLGDYVPDENNPVRFRAHFRFKNL